MNPIRGPVVCMAVFAVLNTLGSLVMRTDAAPIICPSGVDRFSTPGGGQTRFPLVTISYPAGFFGNVGGADSDPFNLTARDFTSKPAPCPGGRPCFRLVGEGCHQGMVGLHCTAHPISSASEDTCVERLQEFTLNNVGDSAQIDIQLLSLSLVSVDPITVTYGSANPRLFDVFVTRDLGAIQSTGSATFTRTGNETVKMEVAPTAGLPVCARVEFRPTAGGTSFFDSPGCDSLSTITPWNFKVIILPSLTGWGVLAFGLLLMATTAWMIHRRLGLKRRIL